MDRMQQRRCAQDIDQDRIADAGLAQEYQGVRRRKERPAVIQDTCAMMEARSEIDKDLAI